MHSDLSEASQAALRTYRERRHHRSASSRPTWDKINSSSSSAALAAASLVARNRPKSMVSLPTYERRRSSYSMGRPMRSIPGDALDAATAAAGTSDPYDSSDSELTMGVSARATRAPSIDAPSINAPSINAPSINASASRSTSQSPARSESESVRSLRRRPPPSGLPSAVPSTAPSTLPSVLPPSVLPPPALPPSTLTHAELDLARKRRPPVPSVTSVAASVISPVSTSIPHPPQHNTESPTSPSYTSQSYSSLSSPSSSSLPPTLVPSSPRLTDQTDSEVDSLLDDSDDNNSDSSFESEIPQYSIVSGQNLHNHHHHRNHHHHSHQYHRYYTGNISKIFGIQSSESASDLVTAGHLATTSNTSLHSPSSPPLSPYIVARPPGERPLIFRTTLRDDKKFKRKKKGRIREFNELKPWKHHKDSTCVEENEKKLYSAVWAANKGVYCDKNVALQEDATIRDFVRDLSNERIHGLIVREIWKRSRLADLVLAKIWSLLMDHRRQLYVRAEPDGQDVNSEQFDDMTLTEEEFIVGMWLIDQCLYGRKLPKVIGDEVWNSVDTINFDMKRLRKRGMMSRLGRHDYK